MDGLIKPSIVNVFFGLLYHAAAVLIIASTQLNYVNIINNYPTIIILEI
jgi:hypothetical protein